MDKPLASIVIPFHNEEISVRKLLPLLYAELQRIPEKIEVLLVDDASTDKTQKIIETFIRGKPEFKLLIRKNQGGQTGSYKTAFAKAKGKFIIRMDGDMQDDPSDLHLFIDEILDGAELVSGLRLNRSHSFINILGSQLYNFLAVLLFQSPLMGNSSSFVAFKASHVKNVPLEKKFLLKNEHRYLVPIALSKRPKKVSEIVVSHNPRMGGASKYKKVGKYFGAFFELIIVFLRIKFGFYK